MMRLFQTSNNESTIEYFERWTEKLIRVYEPICLHLKTNLRFHVLFLFLFVVVIYYLNRRHHLPCVGNKNFEK